MPQARHDEDVPPGTVRWNVARFGGVGPANTDTLQLSRAVWNIDLKHGQLKDKGYRDLPLLGRSHGIIWSAKSASTAVLVWHLAAEGLLSKALAFHPWPHEYRDKRLNTAVATRATRPEKARCWIRVIRDPNLRAVSGYRHALRHNYLDKLPAFLGRPIDQSAGFSFLEYLEYLSSINLAAPRCANHHSIQFQPIERRLPVSLRINADETDLYGALDAFAADRGIVVPERHLIESVGGVVQTHQAWRVQVNEDVSAKTFNAEQANATWPDYSAFLSAGAKAMIRMLYRQDFDAYGDILSDNFCARTISPSLLPADFSPTEYLRLHADVAEAGMDAAKHYVEHGRREGRPYR